MLSPVFRGLQKHLRYIDAVEGSSFALIVFLITAFTLPGHGASEDVQIILTITTFLFAIILGFFITRCSTRFDQLRQIIAEGDAAWLNLYKTAQVIDADFAKTVQLKIDEYYRYWFDYSIGNAYKVTSKLFHSLYDDIASFAHTKEDKPGLVDDFVIQLNNIETLRNRESVLNLERITFGQWAILVTLAGIVTFCVYFLKSDALYSQVIAVLLSTTMVMVLLILRDLENLMLGGKHCLDESGEEVFEYIGMPRYYNKYHIDNGITRLPDDLEEYRLGTHVPGEEPVITVVKQKKS